MMVDLKSFDTASTELLETRNLLKRTDTKYVLNMRELEHLLQGLDEHYCVIRNKGIGKAPYVSQYFDTPENKFLFDHHRGRRPRMKIRIRDYPSRELRFLEVKEKSSRDETSKTRIPLPYSSVIDSANHQGLHEIKDLRPTLNIKYSRITLVGINLNERITIDMDLSFTFEEKTVALDRLVIIEVKQRKYSSQSPIVTSLRKVKAVETRVSKYTTGAQLIWPHLKINRFRPRLRTLRRCMA